MLMIFIMTIVLKLMTGPRLAIGLVIGIGIVIIIVFIIILMTGL